MVYRGLSGQSAIEYLMTYGWMLLVVAVVGGAIFAMVGNQNVESVNGFTGSNVQVDGFGVTEDGDLQLELRGSTGEGSTVKAINVTDERSGEYIYKEFSSNNSIDVGESLILDLPNVSESEGSNSLDVEILYDSGSLTNMSVSGSISGSLTVEETSEITNDGGLSLWSVGETRNYTFEGSSEIDSKYVEELDAGEYELEVHGANGSDGYGGDVNGQGGSGGYVKGKFTASSGDQVEIWVASSNTGIDGEFGGWGRKIGGDGSDYTPAAGFTRGGAGSTAVVLGGTDIAIAAGGGSGAGYSSSVTYGDYSGGGGGGAPGGLGGTATGASDANTGGTDAEGTGNGGDGGDADFGNYAEDGSDGGADGSGLENVIESQIGGSSADTAGEGYVELTYLG